MLSKKHRLSKSADVRKTTAKGRSFFNPYFVIKSTSGQEAKLTVVVSTKISKRAVDRNKIKRIIRDELRKLVPRVKPGNYAILAKQKTATATSKELREAIQQSFKAAKILNS